MKRIRVLEVIHGFGYGGIRAFIMNYLSKINMEEFDVDIYAFGTDSSPFTTDVEKLGAHIYFNKENAVRNIPRFVRSICDHIDKHGPYDVVHAHNNLISAWVLLAAKISNVPVRLAHSHSSEHFKGSMLQRLYSHLRRYIIDRIATQKLACGDLAGKSMYGNTANFQIVANGIDIERFIKPNIQGIQELRKKLNLPDGARVYANVTRVDSPKNHTFAVDVFNEIHKLDPHAIFVYGGVIPPIDSQLDKVQSKIKNLNLTDVCRFSGPISNIEDLYQLSDAWIYSSAYEGLPFGPIELQAAGVPVLVSDVITREIDLGLGLLHFCSLKDSPKSWADIAVKLKKKAFSEDIIKEAFDKHNFNIASNVAMLENIYSNCSADGGRRLTSSETLIKDW